MEDTDYVTQGENYTAIAGGHRLNESPQNSDRVRYNSAFIGTVSNVDNTSTPYATKHGSLSVHHHKLQGVLIG